MTIRMGLVIGLGGLLGALSALALLPSVRDRLLPAPGQITSGKALIGGPFQLVDHHGRRRTGKDFRGTYMLVYFGFTYCPDICPAGLQVITGALDKLGKKAAGLTPLFITVDPERDTPAKMAEYVRSFHPSILGLTGTPEQVQAAARAYRVYFAKVKNPSLPDDYTMDHSSLFYLMDKKGVYVRHFPHSISVDKLANALAAVL